MLFCYLSIVASSLNLSYFVDGLENIDYALDSTNQEVNFFVRKEKLFLFFQKIPDLQIKISKEGQEIKRFSNPFQLSKNSIVKVSANWTRYSKMSNFLIGFIDGDQCDIIYYSNLANYSFHSDDVFPLKKCYYHFHKNSTVKIANENTEMISYFDSKRLPQLKGIVQVYHKKNILSEFDEDDAELEESGGSSMLTMAILFNIAGIILYYIFGFAFGTDYCDKCCRCECCCCCNSFWEFFSIKKLDVDNRDNDFFDGTLNDIIACEGRVENAGSSSSLSSSAKEVVETENKS